MSGWNLVKWLQKIWADQQAKLKPWKQQCSSSPLLQSAWWRKVVLSEMAEPSPPKTGLPGSLIGEVQLAKDIESDRLAFRGRPSFDPVPFLDGEVRAIYEDPMSNSLDPAEAFTSPPHVQVRGKRKEVVKLLQKLDATHRLALLDPKSVRAGREAGLFALMKSTTADRLILDARPANELEVGINDWTASMATIVPLLDWVVPPQQVCVAAGEDLKDYYYFFVVSESRSTRNAIKFKLTAAEAQQMQCYSKAPHGLPEYIPGLATMAMGDVNAVEVGQQSHVKLACSIGISPSDLLTLRGRLPRSCPLIGIVIDDFVVLEVVPRSLPDPHELESSRIADLMKEKYATVGLQANDSKRFRAATEAKFWGVSLRGVEGTLRAQLEKVLPIALITSQVAQLGAANRKLLEILTGSWVAILQYRRRAMCLLEAVFTDIQRCDYGVAFKLSAETVDELWTLVGLCPLFVADLRAEVGQELALVDASGEWEAEVSTQVSGQLAHELSRQKLTKAAWSRLLTPFQARQRLHGLLQPSEEVPEGEQPAANHPLWTMTVKSHQFSLRWRKRTRRRAHINVSELSAALRSEARRCRKFPNHRHLLGSDSQVTLGALVRGRSSSRSLNRHLKQSLPILLAYNGYTNAQYIPTLINTADDPTRNKSCRPAELPEPFWLAEAAAGRFGPLDEVLKRHGIDDAAIARLPTADAGVDATSNTGRPAEKAEDEGDCGALHSEEGPSCSLAPIALEHGSCTAALQPERALPSLAPMPSEPGSCTVALQPDRALPSLAPTSLEHGPCTDSLQPGRALPSLAPMASQHGSCTDALQPGRALPSLAPMASQHGSCAAALQPGQALPSLAPIASQHGSCTTALQPGRALPSFAKQQVRTGRDHRRRKPPVATSPVFEPWLPRRRLDVAALALLTALLRSQFVVPRGLKLDDILAKPGHLDLFSGCRVAAQELANRSGRWVLTYDIEHSHLEDLLSPQVQSYVERMLHHKCFLSVTAGPVCASFSRAVRPAVRSSLHPEGLSDISESMKSKIAIGNSMSQWVAKVVNICLQLQLPFWVENPAGSFLWQQREWADIIRKTPSFTTDYCRWGTPWRKRTRFLGMFSAGGKRCMCQCSRPHLRLTGYSAEYKCSWTKAAQAYPRPLAVFLAKALIESLKPITRQRSLDPSACARCGHRRIGEAANPGPRPRGVRPAVDLEQVQLVQPTTQAIQLRAQRLFLDWLERELSVEAWASVRGAPQLQVLFLRSFGNWLFNQGMPMYLFRHLVVLMQQQFPAERHQITSAWDLLARWELVQPVSHRPPLPKILLDAFVCLALSWGWVRWAATAMLAFHGATRVGEPLRAFRKDLILPAEAGLESEVVFLNIAAPKPGRRGKGKTQHTRITNPDAVRLAIAVFSHLHAEDPLYPATPSSFRRRWDRLLEVLEVPTSIGITPGCVRGGGAVYLYHSGEPISNIQWTMRLRHQGTLESYLQETAALGVIQQLPQKSKQMVQSCSRMLPFLMRIWTSSDSSLSG